MTEMKFSPGIERRSIWIPAIVVGGIFALANFGIMVATLDSKELLDPVSYGAKAVIFLTAAALMATRKNRSGIFLLALGGILSLVLDALFLAVGYVEITIGSGIIPLVFAIITKKRLKAPSD